MKIIEPNVTEVTDFEGVDNFYKAIARAARICYASEKTTDDKVLAERLIKLGHFSPFEHSIIGLKLNEEVSEHIYKHPLLHKTLRKICTNKYTITDNSLFINKGILKYIFNGRVLLESIILTREEDGLESSTIIELLDLILDDFKNYEYDVDWFKSFIVDTSIGCTRELNTHKNNCYHCEQSTRYCNFSKDKFCNEVSFNKVYWFDDANIQKQNRWKSSMKQAEHNYLEALKEGFITDEARGILPIDTHSRAIYTATLEEWNHIIDLRLKGTTGKPHGDIKIIAEKINNLSYDNNKSVK